MWCSVTDPQQDSCIGRWTVAAMLDVFLASSFALAGHSVLTFPLDLRQLRVSKSKQFSEAKAQAARTASLLFCSQHHASSLGRADYTDLISISVHAARDLLSCLTGDFKVVPKGSVQRERCTIHATCSRNRKDGKTVGKHQSAKGERSDRR